MVSVMMAKFKLSRRKVCRFFSLNLSTLTYKEKKPQKDLILKARMKEVAEKYPRYGYPKVHILLKREKLVQNEKKTRRIYSELALKLKRHKRRKKVPQVRVPLEVPLSPNKIWGMDFMSDISKDGKKLKVLNIVDCFSRLSPGGLVGNSITSRRMTDYLDFICKDVGYPDAFRVDNGPEFTSGHFMNWCFERGIKIDYIRPGKPQDNAFIESFNGRMRHECLNAIVFNSVIHAWEEISKWREEYNEVRPHSSLGQKTPREFCEEYWNKMEEKTG